MQLLHPNTKISFFLFFTSLLFFINSCSTSNRSVREIRNAHSTNVKVNKPPKEALTKPLFMTTQKPNISLPQRNDVFSPYGQTIITEEVTYINPEKISDEIAKQDAKPNLNEVQRLNEVTVTAKSLFAPERNGYIEMDFLINVPKEIISHNWRLTLQPQLLHNDSVVNLDVIIIKGDSFLVAQKRAYSKYDEYLKSIINPNKYSEVFFDKKATDKDILRRQDYYYKNYYKAWSKQLYLDNWIKEKENINARIIASNRGQKEQIFNDYLRKYQEESNKKLIQGKDTTGLYNQFMNDYNKRVKYLVVNFGELKDKPLKTNIRDARRGYNNLEKTYSEGTQLKDIKNHIFTSADSINIAKTRYDFMEIAKNEMKEERKEDMFNNMIPFPYEKNTDLSIRLDTVLNGEHDFIFHYKQKYPVTIGLKKLAVTMASKVDALDRSSFTLDKADTLSYFIASLSQLIDTATVYKTTHRDIYNKLSTDIMFKKNTPSFDINYNSNKMQIDTLLYTYNTFASESNIIIDSLSIYVSTSLNGNFDKNYQLSQKRAESLKKYLAPKIELADSLIITKGTGEDWNTFAKLILSNKNIQNKDEIIKMLENAVIPDETKDKIKKDYPADFNFITDSIYPKLDKVEVIINMHRPNMNDKVVTEAVVRPNYEKGLALLADRDYWAALEILSQYPDYNTALCLVCMGYNAKAKELLDKLPITANNEYLLAIINTRSDNDEQAIKHLLKACELDKNKLFRIKLDPEINELVNKHNLNDRLVINN